MDGGTLALIVAGAAVAGFVQGLSGFGFAMVAMSFWAWGLAPKTAAVLAVFGGLSGQVFAALTVRRGFDLPLLAPFIAGGLLGIPLGLWLLPRFEPAVFRAFVGALLVIWCPAMLLAGRLPRIQFRHRFVQRAADGLAGVAGGLMGPLGGFTGALPTLWCTLRNLPKEQQRAVIQNFNLAMLALTMASYLAAGQVGRELWPQLALVLPALLLPAWLGTRVYLGISDKAFRSVVLGLLTVSGIALLAAALPQLL
ncbi:sulfite exporter TauE/SafE family protein [Aquincola sp. S2]|uniref:Probable membrane transporter protein n=1 Tax=Pseudaquabacterium terrae TaxID=2732868 RepID=A0ABX2EHQ3_9BURK|nr:sulfite exporter TauE/SafE family protein [Aquabacterium terrae]NRF68109.1 sulfite exporter TauE/SafE family protein [Aquabacterium terrae]